MWRWPKRKITLKGCCVVEVFTSRVRNETTGLEILGLIDAQVAASQVIDAAEDRQIASHSSIRLEKRQLKNSGEPIQLNLLVKQIHLAIISS